MEIARNAVFEKEKLILKGFASKRLADLIEGNISYKCSMSSNNLEIYVGSASRAREVYKDVMKIIMHTPHIEKFGFRFCNVLNYGFLIYLTEYRDGIENEVNNNPLSEELDIVTLPDRDGYYYSTLYGIDNINIPAILTLGNLFVNELSEIIEKRLSLPDLVEVEKMSKKILKLERMGNSTLLRLARGFEKLSSIEETLKKVIIVRSVLSNIVKGYSYEELQKVRKLGNGLCVYLSKKIRKHFDVREGDTVSLRVEDENVILRKVP
ncbi:AbrB/MazE/SpoVT family DNA-binding domain-containing protein [Archaeoglobus sp.]